jgi:hypothetical protein
MRGCNDADQPALTIHEDFFCTADTSFLRVKCRSGVELLVASLKFLVSGSTSEFQRSETNNLKLET